MIGIIEYGAGNLFSLTATLSRLELNYKLIKEPLHFQDDFSHFIIPGVGHAEAAKNKLIDKKLWSCITTIKKPILGICVGMQLLTKHSEEGEVDLLNIIPLSTKKFIGNQQLKVPHMGWNSITNVPNDPLFASIPQGEYFYYVHSYYVEYSDIYTLSKTEYTLPFSSSIRKENFWGVQFHPEKSGQAGAKLLHNFAQIEL